MARSILVADDSAIVRRMLCQIFDEEDDYNLCAEATNGQEAVDLAIKHRPELIILDLSMPVMDGLEVSRELRKIMPAVRIILFTNYADLGQNLFPKGSTVDRVVSKADASQLMQHIRELIPA